MLSIWAFHQKVVDNPSACMAVVRREGVELRKLCFFGKLKLYVTKEISN